MVQVLTFGPHAGSILASRLPHQEEHGKKWNFAISHAFSESRARVSLKRTLRDFLSVKRNYDCRATTKEKSSAETFSKVTKIKSHELGWLPAFPHVLLASVANFLFGYHIGITNGPITAIAKELGFDGEPLTEGLVVSIFVAAAFFGSLSSGLLADKIGRRKTLQLNMLPLIFGTLLSGHADSVDVMILGRFLVGIGIGANTVLVPIYISEVSPTKYRGSLGSLCQFGTCIGMIVALVLGIPSDTDPHWWRTLFYLGSIPGLLMILGLQFVAESPRWLGKVGRWDEVKRIISDLWGESELESGLKDLQAVNDLQGNSEEAKWTELLTQRYYKATSIGGALFFLQQFAGINGILYFSSLTFTDVGLDNALVASVAVGIVNLVGATVALSLMDKLGRQKLLIGSYIGMGSSMFLLVFSLGVPLDQQIRNFLSLFGTLMYVFMFSLGAGPVTGIIIPELSSTRIRAKTMSFSLCVHWVCNFIVGLFFLDMVQIVGLGAIYASFGTMSILAAMFSYYFIIETKGRSLEEIELLLNPDLKN